MKAEAKSLRFLGESNKLSVPFFQRHYVWSKDNWEELLNSLEGTDVTPFLGSLILKELSGLEFSIIDGQQRLTTVTILAKAIFDSLPEANKKPDSGVRTGIQSFLFYRVNEADDFEESLVKIEHSRIDNQDYSKVIKAGILNDESIDLDTINEHSSNILLCYKFYREKFDGYTPDRLKKLFNLIFDRNRKVIIVIELGRDDVNEQTIFDTINRAGVRLSAADIIKNNLFKILLDKCNKNEDLQSEVIESYKTNWDNVFSPTQDVSDLWDEERVFGNVKHCNLEFLLYCIACIKWGEDCDMFPKLEAVYNRETEQMNYAEIMALVVEIKDYANIFMEYVLKFKNDLEDESKNIYFKYDNHVDRLLLILQKFKIQMFYPYILKRLKEVNCDEANSELIEDFAKLESFIVRRKISTKGTNDYTSKCYNIIKNGIDDLILSDLANIEAGITDADTRGYLSKTKDDAAKMILFCIELYRRKRNSIDVDALEYKYTLEHIMPQKWETHWSNVPIVDGEDVLLIDSEEGKQYRKAAIESIGNKTLLTCSLNSSLKHAEFEKKINGDGDKKPGYKSHTTLLLTRDIVEAYDLDNEWDENRITNRADALFNEFLILWPSFSECITPVEETVCEHDEDPDLSKYTQEQLDNPIELLGVL